MTVALTSSCPMARYQPLGRSRAPPHPRPESRRAPSGDSAVSLRRESRPRERLRSELCGERYERKVVTAYEGSSTCRAVDGSDCRTRRACRGRRVSRVGRSRSANGTSRHTDHSVCSRHGRHDRQWAGLRPDGQRHQTSGSASRTRLPPWAPCAGSLRSLPPRGPRPCKRRSSEARAHKVRRVLPPVARTACL